MVFCLPCGGYTMNKANLDVKFEIKRLGFSQAQVAEEMGISYSYFTKLLQIPLNPRFRRLTNNALQKLVKKRQAQQQIVLDWYNNPESGLLGDDFYKRSGSGEK